MANDKLSKLIAQAKALNVKPLDPRYDVEEYDDGFITGLLGMDMENSMEFCISNNITNDIDLLAYIGRTIFKEDKTC